MYKPYMRKWGDTGQAHRAVPHPFELVDTDGWDWGVHHECRECGRWLEEDATVPGGWVHAQRWLPDYEEEVWGGPDRIVAAQLAGLAIAKGYDR
jgi:hypothetical protein